MYSSACEHKMNLNNLDDQIVLLLCLSSMSCKQAAQINKAVCRRQVSDLACLHLAAVFGKFGSFPTCQGLQLLFECTHELLRACLC